MAYSTPLTAIANATLTAAQWNASVRDNILETPAAKATATGRMYISNGVNSIAERIPSRVKTVGAAQSTTSATPTDLTTVGPTVGPLNTGTSAIWIVSAYISHATAGSGGYMGVTVSGASAVAMDLLDSLRILSATASLKQKASYVYMHAGTLTAGSNTFTAKYASTTGGTSAIFEERELIVLPL
jgi:hypothetical protein